MSFAILRRSPTTRAGKPSNRSFTRAPIAVGCPNCRATIASTWAKRHRLVDVHPTRREPRRGPTVAFVRYEEDLTMSPTHTEPAHDILRPRRRSLGEFFAPRGVAVIGATETPGSVGR